MSLQNVDGINTSSMMVPKIGLMNYTFWNGFVVYEGYRGGGITEGEMNMRGNLHEDGMKICGQSPARRQL